MLTVESGKFFKCIIAWSLHKCSNPYIIMKSKFIGKFVECTNQQAHLCFLIFRSSCSVEIWVTFGNFRSRLQQMRPRNISEMSMKIFVEFPIPVLIASLLHYVKATKPGSNYKILWKISETSDTNHPESETTLSTCDSLLGCRYTETQTKSSLQCSQHFCCCLNLNTF